MSSGLHEKEKIRKKEEAIVVPSPTLTGEAGVDYPGITWSALKMTPISEA